MPITYCPAAIVAIGIPFSWVSQWLTFLSETQNTSHGFPKNSDLCLRHKALLMGFPRIESFAKSILPEKDVIAIQPCGIQIKPNIAASKPNGVCSQVKAYDYER